MEAWEEHRTKLPEACVIDGEVRRPGESIYGFAYWLIRWSGLVRPNEGAIDEQG